MDLFWLRQSWGLTENSGIPLASWGFGSRFHGGKISRSRRVRSALVRLKVGTCSISVRCLLKIEFYDSNDATFGILEGGHWKVNTKGQRVNNSLKSEMTPSGNDAVRFTLIACNNESGFNILYRIFWYDADTIE